MIFVAVMRCYYVVQDAFMYMQMWHYTQRNKQHLQLYTNIDAGLF